MQFSVFQDQGYKLFFTNSEKSETVPSSSLQSDAACLTPFSRSMASAEGFKIFMLSITDEIVASFINAEVATGAFFSIEVKNMQLSGSESGQVI